ncbi:hypothetical protein JW752_01920 [Candidatus Peregrinibacteria bacterium]|nr:hypothetical protein [Candidatus Peregrinibacteria bacterium]
MNKLNYLIITVIISLSQIPSALAQGFGRNEVELTPPVGGDILPGGQSLTGDVETSLVFSKVIPFAIQFLIGLAVALSVVALIIGGYQFMTAYGNEEQHKNAQKTITYALIGLILAITAYGIVKIITTIQLS